MNGILHRIGGYLCIRISGEGALDAVNALNAAGKRFWALCPEEDGFSLRCSLFDADGIKQLLDGMGAKYGMERFRGLPRLLRPFKKRPGLFVGMLLAMLICYAAGNVVWDVRINCNGEYNEAAVRQALSELGVSVGVPVKSINIYRSELQFLVNNNDFSDIAVNIEGTVASVELRLKREAPRHPPLLGYCDIVAKEAGVIKSITARHGVPAVKAGDTVEAGQLLISGLMVGKFGENYLYHAEGSITATVQREFFVAIDLESSRKEYTGREKSFVAYEILGKEFKMYREGDSGFEKAEIYTETVPITLFGMKTPVQKYKVTYKEYKIVEESISEAEAERRAYAALKAYIERETGKATDVQAVCTHNEETGFTELSAIITVETEIGVESVNSVEAQ